MAHAPGATALQRSGEVRASVLFRPIVVRYVCTYARKRTLFVRYCKWRIFASFSLVEGGTRSTNKAAVDGRREERRVPSVDRNVEPEGRVVLGNSGHSNRSSVARTEWNGGETPFWSDGLVLPPVYVEQVCWSVGLVLSTYIDSVLISGGPLVRRPTPRQDGMCVGN